MLAQQPDFNHAGVTSQTPDADVAPPLPPEDASQEGDASEDAENDVFQQEDSESRSHMDVGRVNHTEIPV